MRRILFGILCVLSWGWAGAAQPVNAWSTQDYDFYAGDFNGDGNTDILFVGRNPSLPSGILLSDGTAPTILGQTWASNYLGIPWSSNAYTVVVGDFNGDGKADIFLQSNGPGDSYLLLTDSSGQISAISQTIPAQAMGLTWTADQYHLVVGDFNGARRAGLFFQPTAPGGTAAVMYTDENGQFTSSAPAQTWDDGYLGFNWSLYDANVYAGDFNGDGLSDLLIQAQPVTYSATSNSYAFNMNGVVLAQAGPQPFLLSGVQSWSREAFGVDWSPFSNNLVVADFNGDGRDDVLFQPLTANGTPSLLFGNAPGPIFTTASGPLPSDVAISLDAAVLVAGNFGGGSTAGLLIQSTSRSGTNSIATNIGSGIHSRAITFPVLSATSVSMTGIGYPSGAVSPPAAGAPAPQAGTIAPSSAGRTAAQFSVTPTGAASYNIPLWTPPGARGIEPHLALHYTSGGPDGPMGPGWSLTGTSAIVRCGKTWVSSGGTPTGVALSTSDDICLDGNRLRLTSGTQGVAGSTYQTEIADFSLVTAYGTQGNGPQYFIVQGKDGHYYEYGNTPDSRIYNSGGSTPYAWALNKVHDRQLNNMVFTYSGGTVLTLTKIQYTATPGTVNAAPYEVDFNYVARTGGTTITKYVAGSTVSQTQQLDNVTVLSLQPSSTTVRKYQLGYQASPTTTRPLLQTVQECGGSAGTDCIRPTTIAYQAGGTGWSSTATTTNLTLTAGGSYIPIDMNGDGYPDALYATPSGSNLHWYLKLGSASGYGSAIDTGLVLPTTATFIVGNFSGGRGTQFLAAPVSTWYVYSYSNGAITSASTGVPVNGEYLAADYDGDGLPDLVSVNSSNTVQVRRNTTAPGGAVSFASTATTVWTPPAGYGLIPLGSSRAAPLTPADFNADGRADLLVSTEHLVYVNGKAYPVYELEVLLSNGFGASATDVPLLGDPPIIAIGDWNGDGCSDIITGATIYISNCAGGFTTLSTNLTASSNFWAVDWDGDGQTDLVYDNSGTLYLVRSTGSGMAAPVSLGISTQSFIPIDQNSDGQVDLAYFNTSGTLAYYAHNGVNIPPDLANSIADGFGINFSPTYIPISQNNYSVGTDAVFPDIDFQGPMYVVNQFSASDGLGGTYTNDFSYSAARLNLQGRGFEGFYWARQHDSRNGVYQYSYYERTFPYIGSLFRQDTLESDGATYMARTLNTYTSSTPGGLSGTTCTLCYFPYISTSTVYNFEPTGSKKGGSGAYVSYTTTNYTYDGYGNLTDTKATTTDTDSAFPASPFNGDSWITEIANTITNDNSAANWCLGRPSNTTTTKTVPGLAAQTRTVAHTIDYAKCRATVETVEPNDTHLKVTTSFGFDACGNTNSVSVVGLNQNGAAMPARTTTTNYSYSTPQRCALPEAVTNALSQTTVTAYNYNFGLPSSTTDPNNIITASWLYDDFGRKTKETRPDGTYTTIGYTDCVTSTCWGVTALRFLAVTNLYNSAGTLLRAEEKFYDGLDRVRYEEGDRVLGVWDTAISSYDNLGRKIRSDLAYSSSSNGYHLYTYDVANRATQDALYNSSGALYRTIGMGYAGQTVTVTDPNTNTITKVSDVAGKIRRVTDPSTNGTVAGPTNYTFDPFGNLITILDADNITSSYSYNIRGFKIASADADAGSWTFTPDSLNELVSQTDANNQVTTFGYDLLGRMTGRTEPESTMPTQWVYGTSATLYEIGKLKSVSKPDGYGEAYVYDSVGRTQTVTYTEDGTNYPFTYGYNNQGTLDTLTYPVSTSGYQFVLKSVYDAYGYLNEVKDNAAGTVFWALNSANDSNLPTLETLGNGAQVASSYTPWTNEMITRSEGTGGSTTNLQNLTYNWDVAGNLHERIDNRQSLTEQFAYDSMNRLLSSTLNSANNLTLTYDASGNIASKSDVSASAYVYDTTHKHAVKTAGSWSMTYDANGNMITRAGGLISWYSYNLPNTINYTSNSTQFFYNSSHQRWKQVANYSGVVETTHYIGGLLEIMTRGSAPTEYRHQIPAGSSTAVYTRRTDGTTGTYYATSDHLGSSDLVLDSAANVLARESFTPFGARRGSNWTGTPTVGDYTAFGNSTRKGFTEHEMLDSVSLVHMNGRVYDPYLGRFLSADTVIQSLGATESINPYAYAWNDPLKYTDPSGHSLGSFLVSLIAAVVTVVAYAILDYYFGPVLALFGAGFAGGFTGALLATGSLSAALTAGLISGAMLGTLGPLGAGIATVAIGCASGGSSGNCGRLAAAEAFSLFVGSPAVGGGGVTGVWGTALSTVEAGVVGGIESKIAGGSFSCGFSDAAGSYLGTEFGGSVVSAFTNGSGSGANHKAASEMSQGERATAIQSAIDTFTRDNPNLHATFENDSNIWAVQTGPNIQTFDSYDAASAALQLAEVRGTPAGFLDAVVYPFTAGTVHVYASFAGEYAWDGNNIYGWVPNGDFQQAILWHEMGHVSTLWGGGGFPGYAGGLASCSWTAPGCEADATSWAKKHFQ